MSRPTNEHKYEQAEQWMLETFGSTMQDHAAAHLHEPLSVAVVEVDRLFKVSGVRRLLTQWRDEDALSRAGRKSFIDATGALALMLVQLRTGRHTLLTDMARTVARMSATQRAVLGIRHDGADEHIYERLWYAVHKLIALVDEFPGRRDKVLTRDEYREVVRQRDPVKCKQRRERMFMLGNALAEGTWQMLPREIRDRWQGNLSQDATVVPLQGKAGNPAARNLEEGRRSVNYDGGYYRRDGDHFAQTHSDARAANRASPGAKEKGTSVKKLNWGAEGELVRMVPNLDDDQDLFPLLTLGLSYHIPGAIAGEALRLLESLRDRGHETNYFIVDRAYSAGKFSEFHVPIRRLGAKLVFDYTVKDLGVKAHHPSGLVQVGGAWYLDSLPTVLRHIDSVFLTAKNTYKQSKMKLRGAELTDAQRAKAIKRVRKSFDQALTLYNMQLDQRGKYMLLRKGHMDADGTRRYLIPTDAPGYQSWKAKPGTHQGKTIAMKFPTLKESMDDTNAGGLKMEQHFPYGTTQWRNAYGKRNGIESANRNVKRSQFEGIADPDTRAVRGNTFTYLVIALAAVAENLRQMISFFQRHLAVKPLTSKNKHFPATFWRDEGPTHSVDLFGEPPG